MGQESTGTFLSSSTTIGRLYGQGANDECWFDVALDDNDDPCVLIRVIRPLHSSVIRMPPRSYILVQLFEQPDVLWLASAIALNGTPLICYAPIDLLETADGRTQLPVLAEVPLEKVDESVNDAMSSRERKMNIKK